MYLIHSCLLVTINKGSIQIYSIFSSSRSEEQKYLYLYTSFIYSYVRKNKSIYQSILFFSRLEGRRPSNLQKIDTWIYTLILDFCVNFLILQAQPAKSRNCTKHFLYFRGIFEPEGLKNPLKYNKIMAGLRAGISVRRRDSRRPTQWDDESL